MSIDRFLTQDGTPLAYEDVGSGPPVIWQHGLCGDRQQAAEMFPEDLHVRRISLECRGHGESSLGDPTRLSISQFAADIIALLDHLGIAEAAFGGLSMGAAISLRLAALQPSRVEALILARPAWTDSPAPATIRPFLLLADLLKTYGTVEGLHRLEQSAEFAALEQVSPDNAAALRGCFAREARSTFELASRIAKDGPGLSRDQISAIAVPALTIGTAEDYIHPLNFATTLQQWIPGARMQKIVSKTVDRPLHVRQMRTALSTFLRSTGWAK